jgi:hypothetical protein
LRATFLVQLESWSSLSQLWEVGCCHGVNKEKIVLCLYLHRISLPLYVLNQSGPMGYFFGKQLDISILGAFLFC